MLLHDSTPTINVIDVIKDKIRFINSISKKLGIDNSIQLTSGVTNYIDVISKEDDTLIRRYSEKEFLEVDSSILFI